MLLGEKARALREEFDRSFALPVHSDFAEWEDLLAIRVHGDGYLLRVLEISRLDAARNILRLPGSPPALLGLAGIRAALIPVWDLSVLLGYGATPAGSFTARGDGDDRRWLALVAGETPWALGFESFEGYFRVPRADMRPKHENASATAFVRQICPCQGEVLPVLCCPLMAESIIEMTHTSQARSK